MSSVTQSALPATAPQASTAAAAEGPNYDDCLRLARGQAFEEASRAFETFLSRQPQHHKAWISYAQMSKKRFPQAPALAQEACQSVLDRGIAANPGAAQLWQARGLLELQRGDTAAARGLLEKAVALDPALAPVLKWKAVEGAAGGAGALA